VSLCCSINAVARLHLQQVRVVLAGRAVADPFVVADPDRVRGIEPDDMAVLDIDGRNAVASGGHDERVLEAHVVGTRGDLAVPVGAGLRTEAEVPFADDAGGIAGLLRGIRR
jgi:hypothetical protein